MVVMTALNMKKNSTRISEQLFQYSGIAGFVESGPTLSFTGFTCHLIPNFAFSVHFRECSEVNKVKMSMVTADATWRQ